MARSISSLPALSTPVTSTLWNFGNLASCMAKVPTPPPAPLIRTFCPDCSCPLSNSPCTASIPACGIAAACSKVIRADFNAKAFPRTDVLRESPKPATPEAGQIAEDFVAWPKSLDLVAHGRNSPGDIATEDRHPRRNEPDRKRGRLEGGPSPNR